MIYGSEIHKILAARQEVRSILGQVRDEIKRLSSDFKKEDEVNHVTITQMYLIEIMIGKMMEEMQYYLRGEYSEAVLQQIKKLRQHFVDVNDEWENFRKTFV